MKRAISTRAFLQHRLTGSLLDHLLAAGPEQVEIYAARHHFNYTDKAEVRELGAWFAEHGIAASLHQPVFESRGAGGAWSRHVAPSINLIAVEKSRRIDAMDEVKRALESAEQIPYQSIVLHLGTREDSWSERTLDLSLTAVEHIKAFAAPLGVRTLLETLPNTISTPEHLLQIIQVGHFERVGICVDLGHLHLERQPLEETFALLGSKVNAVHLNDNHGERDEHLLPFAGTVDWPLAARLLAQLPAETPALLEGAYEPEPDLATVGESYQGIFSRLEEMQAA